jgi:apolipoprotein N-acyltransferase
VSLILFIVNFGIIELAEERYGDNGLGINVRLVQPNFNENIKNNPGMFKFILGELISSIGENSDITFLPETALPFAIVDGHNKNLELFKGKGVILSGVVMVKNGEIFNSIALIEDGKVTSSYNKIRLVPFGEYLPLRKFLPNSLSNFVGIDFSRGNRDEHVMEIKKIGKIFPIICYETLFRLPKRDDVNLIVNLTNDIWIGNSGGAYQHFTSLRFRAVENRLPAVRVSNNGIGGYINKYGRVIKKTKLNEKAVLDLRI